MSDSNITVPYQTAEYSKFIKLDQTVYPAVSVVRNLYPDQSQAFPDNYTTQPVSSIDVYPKYGVLTHITNPEDISVSLSAGQVNVNLQDIEDLVTANNAYTLLQSYQLSAIETYVDDLEKNTFDTASAADDIYYELLNLKNNGFNVSFFDSPNLDAFGRLRVSEPKTILDAKHLYDKLPLLFSEKLSGTATSTFSANDSMVVMSTNAPGSFAIRQTRYHFNYQPGKSLQAFFTGKLEPQNGIIKRMGLYQSLTATPAIPSDGIYLEVTGENGPCFHITKTQGTPHSMSFPRSEWNVDKLDGTGPSGVTIAMSAAQIFVIDYEWLSLGRIRFGFMQSGKTYYAHYVNHINDLDRPYITSPNQPVRYEIIQTGANPGNMHHICSTVMIEGGEEDLGKPIALSDGVITNLGSSNHTALLAVRLDKSAHDSVVVLKAAEAINIGGNAGEYSLILNPTYISTPFTWTKAPSAAVDYATGGAIVSGGYTLFRSFVPSGLGASTNTGSLAIAGEITKLGIDIDGNSDVVVLAAKTFASPGTTDMVGAMNLLERS